MSRYTSPDEGSPPPPPEKESVPTRRVALVMIVMLSLFTGAVLLVWKMLGKEERQLLPTGPPAPPTELSKPKIGIVEQRLLSLSRRGLEQRAQQLERLQSYGWIDREKGILHIPIEVAMDRIVEESNR